MHYLPTGVYLVEAADSSSKSRSKPSFEFAFDLCQAHLWLHPIHVSYVPPREAPGQS